MTYGLWLVVEFFLLVIRGNYHQDMVKFAMCSKCYSRPVNMAIRQMLVTYSHELNSSASYISCNHIQLRLKYFCLNAILWDGMILSCRQNLCRKHIFPKKLLSNALTITRMHSWCTYPVEHLFPKRPSWVNVLNSYEEEKVLNTAGITIPHQTFTIFTFLFFLWLQR